MARYPEIPSMFFAKKVGQNTYTQEEVYRLVQQWGAALINELDLRDSEVNASPSTNIFTVVTVSEIGRPQAGDIVYAASAGKFRGYVSSTASIGWVDLGGP
tara:strand:- start:165 stop:467 length:303 start_codon:yes stop_codon:yes gene_type:complete